jgi:hypothetical protein
MPLKDMAVPSLASPLLLLLASLLSPSLSWQTPPLAPVLVLLMERPRECPKTKSAGADDAPELLLLLAKVPCELQLPPLKLLAPAPAEFPAAAASTAAAAAATREQSPEPTSVVLSTRAVSSGTYFTCVHHTEAEAYWLHQCMPGPCELPQCAPSTKDTSIIISMIH